jgi:hypothetical protein
LATKWTLVGCRPRWRLPCRRPEFRGVGGWRFADAFTLDANDPMWSGWPCCCITSGSTLRGSCGRYRDSCRDRGMPANCAYHKLRLEFGCSGSPIRTAAGGLAMIGMAS